MCSRRARIFIIKPPYFKKEGLVCVGGSLSVCREGPGVSVKSDARCRRAVQVGLVEESARKRTEYKVHHKYRLSASVCVYSRTAAADVATRGALGVRVVFIQIGADSTFSQVNTLTHYSHEQTVCLGCAV